MDGNVSARGVSGAPLLPPLDDGPTPPLPVIRFRCPRSACQRRRRNKCSGDLIAHLNQLLGTTDSALRTIKSCVCFIGQSYLSRIWLPRRLHSSDQARRFRLHLVQVLGGGRLRLLQVEVRARNQRYSDSTQILLRGTQILLRGTQILLRGLMYIGRTGKHRATRRTQGSSRNHHTDLGSSGSPAD